MNVETKTLIKLAALFVTACQAYDLFYLQHAFSAVIYASGVATLFGGSSLHENFQAWTQRTVDSVQRVDEPS